MKAGDVSQVRTSSRETWLSTPLSDPNATLWASITPPANPTLSMSIQRHARALSFDMLAHRLYVRFPQTFSSRATARLGILGALLAFTTSAGGLGYWLTSTDVGVSARPEAPIPALASAAPSVAATTSFVRLGETVTLPVAARREPPLASASATVVTEQVTERLTPRAAQADAETKVDTQKAKRSTTKKVKNRPRRATKPRRTRSAAD